MHVKFLVRCFALVVEVVGARVFCCQSHLTGSNLCLAGGSPLCSRNLYIFFHPCVCCYVRSMVVCGMMVSIMNRYYKCSQMPRRHTGSIVQLRQSYKFHARSANAHSMVLYIFMETLIMLMYEILHPTVWKWVRLEVDCSSSTKW